MKTTRRSFLGALVAGAMLHVMPAIARARVITAKVAQTLYVPNPAWAEAPFEAAFLQGASNCTLSDILIDRRTTKIQSHLKAPRRFEKAADGTLTEIPAFLRVQKHVSYL